MPIATLRFKLPEEEEEFRLAQKGSDYAIVIEDLRTWLRHLYKYEDRDTVTIEEVREKIAELINERDI